MFLQVSTTLRPLSRFRGSAWGEKHLGVAREGVSGKVLDLAQPSCEMQEVSKRTVTARLELARQYRAALRCGLRSQRIGGVFIEGPGCDTCFGVRLLPVAFLDDVYQLQVVGT